MSERANQTEILTEVSEAFTSAAVTALQELTQFEAFPASISSPFSGETVIAVMRLEQAIPGELAVIMSAETAERLAERYLPAGSELTTEIINDVAGELTNVIAGQAKTMLKGTPYHFLLSIPAVSRIDKFPTQPSATISLVFEQGQIHLHITLHPVARIS